jgi:LmbE family N-acetylglucosaminyl deacetylase
MIPTLLAVFAHPDDEVFGTGGTLKHYADQGMRVVLVCATRGEVGEISDPALATPETLAEVRENELRCAAEKLGIHELFFLDYRDSGMAGTPDNDDPRCFHRADPDEVTLKLVEIIRRIQPQVVVTFEPFGGYGHPDHIAAHLHTNAAFDAAGDPNRYREAGPAFQPDRLFYSVIPMKFFREMRERMIEMGMDVSQWENFDQEPRRFPDEKITTVIDVDQNAGIKWDAAKCHATQWGADTLFNKMPDDLKLRMAQHEYFAQARPDPESGAPKHDLFEGLPVSA